MSLRSSKLFSSSPDCSSEPSLQTSSTDIIGSCQYRILLFRRCASARIASLPVVSREREFGIPLSRRLILHGGRIGSRCNHVSCSQTTVFIFFFSFFLPDRSRSSRGWDWRSCLWSMELSLIAVEHYYCTLYVLTQRFLRKFKTGKYEKFERLLLPFKN